MFVPYPLLLNPELALTLIQRIHYTPSLPVSTNSVKSSLKTKKNKTSTAKHHAEKSPSSCMLMMKYTHSLYKASVDFY
jgi:hypothetical protein